MSACWMGGLWRRYAGVPCGSRVWGAHSSVGRRVAPPLLYSSSRLADETALATAHATGTGPLPASRMCLPGCQQRLLKPKAAPGRHARKIVAATSCFFADGVAWNAVGHSSREHESRALCVGSSSAHLRFLWPIERHYSGVLFFSIVGQWLVLPVVARSERALSMRTSPPK